MKRKHCEHTNNLWSFTAKPLSFLNICLAMVSALGFAGCATSPETAPAGADMASVTGTVVYTESIKLPAETEVQISLVEMIGKYGPAKQVTVQNIKRNIEVPIPFALRYDPKKIVSGRTYLVEAQISAKGKSLYVTPDSQPVITNNRVQGIQVPVKPVGAQGTTAKTVLVQAIEAGLTTRSPGTGTE